MSKLVKMSAWALVLASVLPVAMASPAARMPAPTLESCSWNRPGHNPFMGDVVAAVDRYADIPKAVRERLKARMAVREYDEVVSIRRDSIEGRATYDPVITDMHFGTGRVCRSVDRSGWTDAMHERGLVYCEGGHCILVPTVCRNVSRITRRAAPVAVAGAGAGTPVITPTAAEAPLAFDAPGAGGGMDDALPPSAGGPAPTLSEVPSTPMSGPLSSAPWSFAGGVDPRAQPTGVPGFGGPASPRGGGSGGGPRPGPDTGPSGPGPYLPPAPPPGPGPGVPVAVVPEPSTLLMALAGLAALCAWTRRRQAPAAARS